MGCVAGRARPWCLVAFAFVAACTVCLGPGVSSAAANDGTARYAPPTLTLDGAVPPRQDRDRPRPTALAQGRGVPPTRPRKLRVTVATANSVTVAWKASKDDVGVSGYGIYVGGIRIDTTTATSYTLGDLQCGTSRLLAVDAYDAAGNRSRPAEVTASTSSCPDTSPPTTPGNLRVIAATASSLTVAWDASSDDVGVAGYGIYVGGSGIDSTTATSYTVNGLPCGSSRTLAVDAYDAAANRSPMAVVLATTEACPDNTPPTTPGNLRVTESSTTSVRVAWDASEDDVAVAGYGIYVAGIRIDSTSATSYTLSGLLCGTSRLVMVDAYDVAGNRSQQASVNAGTGACEDEAPPPIAGQGYTMTFRDEFETLGSLAWGESNWYSENSTSQVFVNNGVLNLVSRRADRYPDVTVSGQATPISFQQGYFEARMRWTRGNGAWPGFWLLGARHLNNPAWPKINPYCADNGLPAALCWSAELDVFEGQGSEPTTFYGTVHRNSAGIYGVEDSQNENNAHDVGIDLTAGFHTYGMLWTPTEIRWYLDGQFIHSAAVYDSTNQPMYLLLSMYIGGWTADTDATTPDELKAEFDWVRVWQKHSADNMTRRAPN